MFPAFEVNSFDELLALAGDDEVGLKTTYSTLVVCHKTVLQLKCLSVLDASHYDLDNRIDIFSMLLDDSLKFGLYVLFFLAEVEANAEIC